MLTAQSLSHAVHGDRCICSFGRSFVVVSLRFVDMIVLSTIDSGSCQRYSLFKTVKPSRERVRAG